VEVPTILQTLNYIDKFSKVIDEKIEKINITDIYIFEAILMTSSNIEDSPFSDSRIGS
jgi:hypothetical protein